MDLVSTKNLRHPAVGGYAVPRRLRVQASGSPSRIFQRALDARLDQQVAGFKE